MADLHNRVIAAAMARALELEDRLVDVLRPLLAKAGAEAAKGFALRAVDHVAASAADQADREALAQYVHGGGNVAHLSRSLAIRASADKVGTLSTMVAVMPRAPESGLLAADGGVPADVFHVTLAYLGEYEGDLSDIATALAKVAGGHAPLEGKVGGVGHFADNGNGHPGILLPSVPGLVELRVAVTDALVNGGMDYGREHGFVPHATVDYSADPAVPNPDAIGTPLHFDSLWIVRGDTERIELPLTGIRPITASAGDPPGWSAPAVDEIFDVDAFIAAVKAKTDPVRRAVIETVMTPALASIGLDFDVTNPYVSQLLAVSGQHIVSIADTTRTDIQQAIDASYRNGLSIPNTAKAIRIVMRDAAPIRARTIARTELVGGVNGGSLAAVQIVGDSTGATYSKVWMTAPGARHPRHETYSGLDGQEVAIDDYFDVGGSSMQFPGDPNGDAAEVINCRCTMSYVDQSGAETEAPADYEGE